MRQVSAIVIFLIFLAAWLLPIPRWDYSTLNHWQTRDLIAQYQKAYIFPIDEYLGDSQQAVVKDGNGFVRVSLSAVGATKILDEGIAQEFHRKLIIRDIGHFKPIKCSVGWWDAESCNDLKGVFVLRSNNETIVDESAEPTFEISISNRVIYFQTTVYDMKILRSAP